MERINQDPIVKQWFQEKNTPISLIKLYVDKSQPELYDIYKQHTEKHNKSILTNSFADSGFDLFIPKMLEFYNLFETQWVNLGIRCEMIYYPTKESYGESSPYYLYARSSLSKTPFMIANNQGIIDMGYRGDLIVALRYLFYSATLKYPDSKYEIQPFTKLVQLCHPSLCPIFVVLVENEDELSKTLRNSGGFGSTGIIGNESL